MIKLGVFILPDKNLKLKILKYKKLIKKNFGDQKYLSHLPHCTLCVLNISKKSIREIKHDKILVRKFKRIYKIKNYDIFYDDPITKGNTIIFKIEKNKFLKELQLSILKNKGSPSSIIFQSLWILNGWIKALISLLSFLG